jgi:hypothetical protein
MLFKEIFAAYSEKHTKPVDAFGEQNKGFTEIPFLWGSHTIYPSFSWGEMAPRANRLTH